MMRRYGFAITGVVSLTAGLLFVLLPGHGDRHWHQFMGAVWLLIGVLWLLTAYGRTRRRAR